MDKTFEVKITTPKQTLFEGKVLSISSVNTSGKFDILGFHANFITIVENHPIDIVKENKEKISYQFSQAIVYVSRNKVAIYAEPQSL